MPHNLTHISDTGLSTPFEDSVVPNNQGEDKNMLSTFGLAKIVQERAERAKRGTSLGTNLQESTSPRAGTGFGGVGVFGRGVISTNVIKKRR